MTEQILSADILSTDSAIRELKKVDHLVTTDREAINAAEVALVPEGYRIEDLEEFHDRPRRIRQRPQLQSMESLLEYISKHRNDNSVIFFDEDRMLARFVADYHDMQAGEPAWCDHTAAYQAKLDERWEAWTQHDMKPMNQIELAMFIERRVKDFAQPTGTEMLELATTFQLKKKVTYSKGVNLANGDIEFTYNSTDQGNGTVHVPAEFTLGVPVFKNSDFYQVQAKFRYRLKDEQVIFQYELMNLEDIKRDAVEGMLEKLRESGLTVYLGSL